jgi:ADP-ribose pyrophosphatase YjhB (NUDIX family)
VATLHGWVFCPRCRTTLERDEGRVRCPACDFTAYASSAPTASALVEDGEGRLLLARRAVDPGAGLWDVPGGYLDEGEHPLDGVARELREEAGVEIEPLELLGVWMDRYGDGPDANATLNLYWRARIDSGSPEPADDVAELRWFAPDELPADGELAFANTAQVLAHWRRVCSSAQAGDPHTCADPRPREDP